MLIEIIGSVQLLVVVTGAVWTYVRFFREGQHAPRIDFDIACKFFGPQNGFRVAAFTIYAHNKGNLEHKFSRISLRLLGICSDDTLTLREDLRLSFPHSLAKAEVIPEKFGYFFVRPTVNQQISFTTTIPADMRFVLARAAFKYEDSEDLHTTEKVFDVQQVA
jgi:hypothetical protein